MNTDLERAEQTIYSDFRSKNTRNRFPRPPGVHSDLTRRLDFPGRGDTQEQTSAPGID